MFLPTSKGSQQITWLFCSFAQACHKQETVRSNFKLLNALLFLKRTCCKVSPTLHKIISLAIKLLINTIVGTRRYKCGNCLENYNPGLSKLDNPPRNPSNLEDSKGNTASSVDNPMDSTHGQHPPLHFSNLDNPPLWIPCTLTRHYCLTCCMCKSMSRVFLIAGNNGG